jgi:uroporphyrinogen decarboxylase
MNGRERFLAIARGELRGEVFLPLNLNYSWFMDETLERWHAEGLPRGADLAEFFGLDRVAFTGGGPYSLVPPFELQVLAEDAETRLVRDDLGITKRVSKRHEQSTMPQWLDFPIKSRADFREFTNRLDPRSPSRFPPDWAKAMAEWAGRDYPLGIGPGSFFGHTLQRWVGTENLCMLLYDDPRLVHEMLEYLEWFFLELLKPYMEHVDFDFASFGEDIAYKGRSFISPAAFREFFLPHYVPICELLRSRGVETIFVDSDGFIDELIPLWLEVGINGFSPLEVAAGEDALALKKRYGRDIVLAGNIDKRALARGRAAIDAEAAKPRRLLDLGGYFPAVDHSVPPDVSLDSFRYLLDALRSSG